MRKKLSSKKYVQKGKLKKVCAQNCAIKVCVNRKAQKGMRKELG